MNVLPYHGALKLGDHGTLVASAKRATYRTIDNGQKWINYLKQTVDQRRTFGSAFKEDLIIAQRIRTAGKTPGVFDEPTLRAFESGGAFDAEAKRLWLAWKPTPPPMPPLVKPNQGWASLVDDMWRAYTIGIGMGLKDGAGTASGTYNPNSTLPSGAPSDHATSKLSGRIGEPACAFDLDIVQHTGYANLNARSFFWKMTARREIHYVILSPWIFSKEKGKHPYDGGGHYDHVHVSAYRR